MEVLKFEVDKILNYRYNIGMLNKNSKLICDKLKLIGNLLDEVEEVYENCGRKIDRKEVVEGWDSIVLDFEYLYYVMKKDYKKFDDDGVVLKSISGKGLED
jgi:hypothetical protein